MRTSDFDFDLPRGLIAQHPAEPRDGARLLHVGASGSATGLADRSIADLPDLLRPGDLLVTNDTKVIPARLAGRRGTAGVEVTLHQAVDADGPGGSTWKVFARPARTLGLGDNIDVRGGFQAEGVGKGEAGEVTLPFDRRRGAPVAARDKRAIHP